MNNEKNTIPNMQNGRCSGPSGGFRGVSRVSTEPPFGLDIVLIGTDDSRVIG